jgi:hypothetical protein
VTRLVIKHLDSDVEIGKLSSYLPNIFNNKSTLNFPGGSGLEIEPQYD